MMSEVLVILSPRATPEDRKQIARLAAPTQSISERVYVAQSNPGVLAQLRSAPGIALVLTGSEGVGGLPSLSEEEALFVRAWIAGRQPKKQRIGEGLDWDTPPMTPPDQKAG